MTSETETWKLEKDLCRCCHAEGCFQNLGQRCSNSNELLSDMLRTCFDIEISPVTGLLCALTFTICEQCVARLRDASSFKHQVLRCEERFKHMYRNLGKVLNPDIAVKLEEEPSTLHNDVKEEPSAEEDDFDVNFAVDDDDDEDDDKTVLALQLEAAQKAKRGKAKEKKAPPKAKRKGKSEAPAESNAEEKPKRGDKRLADYYIRENGQYRCKLCDRTFTMQPLVSQHYRFVHLKRRPREHKCPHCDAKFPGHLRAYHLEEVHGIPAPTCGVCQKKFRYPCHVLQHQKKVHMGEKTAVCQICNKSFFNSLSLRMHMSTHSAVKRFKCGVCGREFRWENNLRDHVRIHAGDKRHVCGACGKAFVQKSTLKQHAARNHPGVVL